MAFDLRTHHRDPKTGKITHVTPYRLRITRAPGGGTQQIFERDGIRYHGNGDRIDPIKPEVANVVVKPQDPIVAKEVAAITQEQTKRLDELVKDKKPVYSAKGK